MITHVAIKLENGKIYSLPNPKRHHHILAVLMDKRINPYCQQTQGFLTDTGEFLTREAAAKHAYECDQVSTKFNKLNSEAVW